MLPPNGSPEPGLPPMMHAGDFPHGPPRGLPGGFNPMSQPQEMGEAWWQQAAPVDLTSAAWRQQPQPPPSDGPQPPRPPLDEAPQQWWRHAPDDATILCAQDSHDVTPPLTVVTRWLNCHTFHYSCIEGAQLNYCWVIHNPWYIVCVDNVVHTFVASPWYLGSKSPFWARVHQELWEKRRTQRLSSWQPCWCQGWF